MNIVFNFDKLRSMYEARVVRRDGCWGWNGNKDKNGYGCMCQWISTKKKGLLIRAHVASLVLSGQTITKNSDVMHLCHNPECSNPDHLAIGSRKENMRTSKFSGRLARKIPYDDIPKLRAMRDNGAMWKTLATPYGCSLQAIRYAVINHAR